MSQWREDEIIGLGSAQADLRNPEQVSTVIKAAKPDWIVLAAAYTDVDGCEINPTLASSINTQGAVNVAKAAARVQSKLLFVSTDYVFDGKKASPYEVTDPRNPINAYGRSKAEAEQKIAQLFAGILHCPHLLAFWRGGQVFSRHNTEARRRSAAN